VPDWRTKRGCWVFNPAYAEHLRMLG
jgi:hypothetical protein